MQQYDLDRSVEQWVNGLLAPSPSKAPPPAVKSTGGGRMPPLPQQQQQPQQHRAPIQQQKRQTADAGSTTSAMLATQKAPDQQQTKLMIDFQVGWIWFWRNCTPHQPPHSLHTASLPSPPNLEGQGRCGEAGGNGSREGEHPGR